MVGIVNALLLALHGGELHADQPIGTLALLGLAAVLIVAGAVFLVRRNGSRQRTR